MEIIARSCRDIVRCPVIFPTALQPDGAAGFTRPVGARFKKCEEKADSHNLLRRNMPLRPDGSENCMLTTQCRKSSPALNQ